MHSITSYRNQHHGLKRLSLALTGILFLLFIFSLQSALGQCSIDAGDNVSICNGQATLLTATPAPDCIAPFTYAWTSVPAGGPYDPTQSITVAPLVTTVYTVTFTAQSIQYTDNITVTVYPLTVPTIIGPQTPCKLSAGNVYTTEAGMLGYTWTVSAGGTITAGGTSTSNTVTVTWNTAGPQQVTVDYTDGNGCTAVIPTVYPVTVLGPTLSGPTLVCDGSTGNVYTTEPGMGNTYSWVVNGGSITAGGTPTSNTATVTWNTTGSQSVYVSYTDGACSANTTLPVTVHLSSPSVTGADTTCKGTPGYVYTTEPGMTGYVWTVSAGNIDAGVGTNAITVTWTTAGPQWVQVERIQDTLPMTPFLTSSIIVRCTG